MEKIYLKQNQGINITCSSSAIPKASYSWMKKDGIFGTNVVDHGNGVLEIKKLVETTEVFICTATNILGKDSKEVEIVIVDGN